MTTARRTLLALCVLIGLAGHASAQTVDRQTFDDKVLAIAPLGRVPVDPRAFAGLTPHEQHDVLACRDVLMNLLRSLQTGSDALRYLAPEFANQFKTAADVLASLTFRDTSLMAAGISGVEVADDRTAIQLRFFMLVFSEGRIVTSEEAAVFKKVGSQWRIAGFD
jgi:hypothetical protein